MSTLAKRIFYIRRVILDITQDELALQLGVKRQAVTNWEGGVDPSRENASKLAELAGVTTDWLLHGRGEVPTPSAGVQKKSLSVGQVIELTVEIMEGLRKVRWSDREKILVAGMIREFSERAQSSRVSLKTATRLLELDIRRALQTETLKTQ